MLKVVESRSKKAAAWIGVSAMTLTLLSTAAYQAESATDEVETEAPVVTAAATDGDVILSTDYPGITVEPGASTTFTLYTTNASDKEANLTLTAENVPEGWEGYFKGSDTEVGSVHVSAQQTKDLSPKLSYILTVPKDAEDGTYNVTLHAAGDEIDTSTDLTINVSSAPKASDSDAFTTQYPEQQGASGTAFSFSSTLKNNTSDTESYAMSAELPDRWTATFTPSGASSQVSTIPVEAGQSETVTIAITPAQDVAAGDYKIPVTAKSGDQTLTMNLKVTITGTYSMTLSTPNGNLAASAYAGEDAKVTMVVTNSGNADLENIALSGTGSTDWTVTFDTDTIDALKAGESKEVTATITPSKNSIIGDYVTSMSAKSDNASANADLRISVKNHTTWGIAAVVIIAALIIGLIAIIRKFGRR